jgi:hypothetical protein
MIPLALNKQLHALLTQTNRMQVKPHLVESFTNGRTNSSAAMTHYEAIELVKHLKQMLANKQLPNTSPKPIAQVMHTATKTDADRANNMRKKIIALAHQMGWSTTHVTSGKTIADMPHINIWCIKYGYLHKPLNNYTLAELPKLVTQFDNLYKTFLKAI